MLPGTRLGPYEIVAPIGAGGMGHVFKAVDTRLNRTVAIKVLSTALASDPQFRERFAREARSVSALSHGGICALFDVGQHEGHDYLVLEYLEGETLADRLNRGPIKLDESLRIAVEVGAALSYAHRQGIVHRDLKPANVFLVRAGESSSSAVVKLLDFGLAKSEGPSPEGETTLGAPDGPLTARGTVLGTFQYMSPEQVEAREADARADIWALGCILYEMITGERPFDGPSAPSVMASVLHAEPRRFAAGQLLCTPSLDRLVRRCLKKDRGERWQTATDLVEELRWIHSTLSSPASHVSTVGEMPAISTVASGVATSPPSSSGGAKLAWLVGGLLAGAAAIWGVTLLTAPPLEPAPLVRSQVAIQIDGGEIPNAVISPDGRAIVYRAHEHLWVQRLDEWEPRRLEGTEGATRPFWSPGSDSIGFIASGRLSRVPAAGGTVVKLAQVTLGSGGVGGGAWRDDNTLVVGTGEGGAASSLFTMPAAGGPQRLLPRPSDISDFHETARLPGRSEVLVVLHPAGGFDGIAILDGDVVTPLIPGARLARPAYSRTGHVIYERVGENPGVWAVPFSIDTLKTTGEPFFVAKGSSPSVSNDGTLAYVTAVDSGKRQLAWVDRTGAVTSPVAAPQAWVEGFAVSPDGRLVAAADTDGIWVYDLGTKARRRITRNSGDMTPAWAGQDRIAFARPDAGGLTVMIKSADGTGEEQLVAKPARRPMAFDRGRRLAINRLTPDAWEAAWIDLATPGVIRRLEQDKEHRGARFPEASPDGRYLLYIASDTGEDEVWVTRFPSGQGKWQVSVRGGGWAVWSPAGNEIIFRERADGFSRVSVVSVTPGPEPKFSAPRALFNWNPAWAPYFTLSSDGTKILTAVPVEKPTVLPSVRIVQHWVQEFAK